MTTTGKEIKEEIRRILSTMRVGQDREDAETKALEIWKLGQKAFDTVAEMGREALKGNLQDKRELLRAISFTLALFLTKEKQLARTEAYPGPVDLMVKLAEIGFNSARNCLSHLGFSAKEIWQRQLMFLPLSERHVNDKEISFAEAVIEIELSQSMPGPKGPARDHYALGRDDRHRYELYRTGKRLFALRTTKVR